MENNNLNKENLLKIKKENKIKRIRIGVYLFFLILLFFLMIMGIFVFNKYEFVKEKVIEKKVEVEKEKIIDNYYIFISDRTNIEYTYNSNIYNGSFLNLYFFIKFNDLGKIFINKINGKDLNKDVTVKDLSIDFEDKNGIEYEIRKDGKIITIKQKTLIQLNDISDSLNEEIEILSVNGEKFINNGIKIKFGKFIEIIKKI